MADNYASNNTLAHTPARCGVDPHARVHGVAVLVTVRLWSGGVTFGHPIGVQPTHAGVSGASQSTPVQDR